MKTILRSHSDWTYAALRIMAGVMFLIHGTQKLFGWPKAEFRPALASLPGFAGVIELVCGTLIAIGLLTGIAAFIASGEMAVAYFMVHTKQGWIPLLNQGELAALYCFLFLYIATRGAGKLSIDNAGRGRAT